MSAEIMATGAPADLKLIKAIHTRFLYPFYFGIESNEERNSKARRPSIKSTEALRKGCAALELAEWSRDNKVRSLWAPFNASQLYTDELLEPAEGFLFDPSDERNCRCLRLNRVATEQWFANSKIELGPKLRIAATIITEPLIEVILSPQGVGLVSIALTPTVESLTPQQALDFNYRLAQYRRRDCAVICKSHRMDNLDYWNSLSDTERNGIPGPPDGSEPIEKRLGAPGGKFHLLELVEFLLRPLAELGWAGVQKELSVYTVVRLAGVHDFALEETRREFSTLLSSLVQVEESGHVGAVPGVVSMPNSVLNRGHWAAVGLLGAAHLVRDQFVGTDRVEFDEQKVAILRDKYFIQYLLAFLQRLTLNRVIRDVTNIRDFAAAESDADVGEIHAHLLEFAVRGDFAQVSVRQVLHQYYQLARTGLDVPAAWSEVRQAVTDLDAGKLAKNVDRNIDKVHRVQSFLHIIEYLIVSVYCAHLWHMFSEGNHAIPIPAWMSRFIERLSGGPDDAHAWFVSIGIVIAALFGLVVAFLIDTLVTALHSRKKGRH